MFYFVVEFFGWRYKEKNIFNSVDLVIFKYISCCFYVSETLLSPLPAVDIIVVIKVDV